MQSFHLTVIVFFLMIQVSRNFTLTWPLARGYEGDSFYNVSWREEKRNEGLLLRRNEERDRERESSPDFIAIVIISYVWVCKYIADAAPSSIAEA